MNFTGSGVLNKYSHGGCTIPGTLSGYSSGSFIMPPTSNTASYSLTNALNN